LTYVTAAGTGGDTGNFVSPSSSIHRSSRSCWIRSRGG